MRRKYSTRGESKAGDDELVAAALLAQGDGQSLDRLTDLAGLIRCDQEGCVAQGGLDVLQSFIMVSERDGMGLQLGFESLNREINSAEVTKGSDRLAHTIKSLDGVTKRYPIDIRSMDVTPISFTLLSNRKPELLFRPVHQQRSHIRARLEERKA